MMRGGWRSRGATCRGEIDAICQRFGRDAVGYATGAMDRKRSVPDAFRELAEKDLGDNEI